MSRVRYYKVTARPHLVEKHVRYFKVVGGFCSQEPEASGKELPSEIGWVLERFLIEFYGMTPKEAAIGLFLVVHHYEENGNQLTVDRHTVTRLKSKPTRVDYEVSCQAMLDQSHDDRTIFRPFKPQF